MSERKTAEFKLRCTPEEKIRWQREAEEHDCSLSELVRTTMNVVHAGIPVVPAEGEYADTTEGNRLFKSWMFEANQNA